MPKKSNKIQIPSARSEDQPATRRLVYLVRDELLGKMEAGFSQVSSDISSMRSDISSIRSDISSIRSDMSRMQSEMRSDFSRMQILLEEQNSNNRIVLEGLQAVWQRQDRIESIVQK
ncbi:hypothetical protein K2X30_02610 [bacterium]|jgi:septal ring factor EnvC (AmiA/AmiB activator)|nr:hypothetical protein [bacterium]